MNVQKVEGKVVDLQNHGDRFVLLSINSEGIYAVAVITKAGFCVDGLLYSVFHYIKYFTKKYILHTKIFLIYSPHHAGSTTLRGASYGCLCRLSWSEVNSLVAIYFLLVSRGCG